jgi:starch-binding outer membrane protein, SusD/RagB family
MKKIISKYIVIVPVLIIASGCSKNFLNLTPISNANVNSFYKTAADINNAVIAAYSMNKGIFIDNLVSTSQLDEVRSDNTMDDPRVDNFTNDNGAEWWYWSWDQCYRAIYASNVVIEKAPGVNMDTVLRNQYIAEAMFLRAIAYFELVQNYGDVPVVTSTPKSLSASAVNVKRNTVAEVYALIVSDLLFAAQNLPAKYSASAEIGRATSGAANGLLGKVYLTMGDVTDAKTILTTLVNSGLYQLLPTYSAVFDINSRNSAESLFELQFTENTDPSPLESSFASPAAGIPGGGYYYNQPTPDFVNSFEAGDPRKNVSMGIDANGNYYCTKFNDPAMTSFGNSSHPFPILRYADVLLLLAEADGESQAAYDLINQVRTRATLPPISAATPGTFIEKLLHERRSEFGFEDQRWHDLLRLGVAIQVMNAQLAPAGVTLDSHNLLDPISETTLAANPNLVQNPGYPK